MNKILDLKKELTDKLTIYKTDSIQSILGKTLIKTGMLILVGLGLILGIMSCVAGNPIFGTCLFTIGGLSAYSLLSKNSNDIESFIGVMALAYLVGDGVGFIASAGEHAGGWSLLVTGIMAIFGVCLLKTACTISDKY